MSAVRMVRRLISSSFAFCVLGFKWAPVALEDDIRLHSKLKTQNAKLKTAYDTMR